MYHAAPRSNRDTGPPLGREATMTNLERAASAGSREGVIGAQDPPAGRDRQKRYRRTAFAVRLAGCPPPKKRKYRFLTLDSFAVTSK